MISQLMIVNSEQEDIIGRQAATINELFILLCRYANDEDFEGFTPLLQSLEDTAARMMKCGIHEHR